MQSIIATLLALSLSFSSLAFAADSAPTNTQLVGYSPHSSQSEREWEAKLRAIPDPANLREYMKRLSARPHHVGSPYDKDNAEWILAHFKEWGLDAHIEQFDVLFPTPKVRVLEMLEPKKFTPSWKSLRSPSIQHRIRSPSNCRPITPTPSMATSRLRSYLLITDCQTTTRSSTG
jgi:hypothetical protein